MNFSVRSTQKRILYFATEDWFFASHFLPMARAARREGFELLVVTRVRRHSLAIQAEGIRIIPFEAERGSTNPLAVFIAVLRLVRIFRRERPSIVHLISLRSVLIGGMAATLAGVDRKVFAITGFGFFLAIQNKRTNCKKFIVMKIIKLILESKNVHYILENTDDAKTLNLFPSARNVTLVGGAGIDPLFYRPTPLMDQPPLRVAIVSRMLWSKGIDLAVEAIQKCRKEGYGVTLSLYGAPDKSNPKTISEEQLRRWSKEDGIDWFGTTLDISAVWSSHHLACLPSRGGEGLPRTLLEAAACGRGIVTTDVPGCRDFVRHGLDGLVVPVGDSKKLAQALRTLAADPARVEQMGLSARQRVLDGYTEGAVMDAVAKIYRDMLATD